jgi:hypothetical protein
MYDIEAVINAMKVKKVDRRATTMIQVPAGLPNDKKLGPRCQHIHKFLASEIRLADTLATMVLAVIHPMLEASKGTVLKVVNVTQNNFKTADGNTAVQVVANVNNKALFEDKNSNSKYQTQAIMEALQAADVQIFLHAAEALATGLRDFVDTLRLQCTTGGMFISSLGAHLFAHFLTNYNSVAACRLDRGRSCAGSGIHVTQLRGCIQQLQVVLQRAAGCAETAEDPYLQ